MVFANLAFAAYTPAGGEREEAPADKVALRGAAELARLDGDTKHTRDTHEPQIELYENGRDGAAKRENEMQLGRGTGEVASPLKPYNHRSDQRLVGARADGVLLAAAVARGHGASHGGDDKLLRL